MKASLDYKSVTQITQRYIFTQSGDRFPVTKEYLAEAYKVFGEELVFYSRMLDELCIEQSTLEEEWQRLSRRLDMLEKLREETADDPLVKRGLGTVNWELEVVSRALTETAHKQSGVSGVQRNVVDKTVKYLKLQKDAEAVYHIIAK